MQRYDYLIAGSGLAGLYAAYRASRYGSVAIVTKCKIADSNTYFAQGGIAAVTDHEDSTEFHINDTITAGRGLCDPVAVEIMAKETPLRIEEISLNGMQFDMSGDMPALGLEGGHSKRRVLHAGGDITGRRITEFMAGKILSHHNISIFENHQVLEIITDSGKCAGVSVWDFTTNTEKIFLGGNTILAMGGTSAIYNWTTNPKETLGEGIALCYKAGCRIRNIEFIQFHPTALYTPDKERYLISEAVRGEGAHLVNAGGERFMQAVHPMAELAPRDIVAREIQTQINKTKESDQKCVYLSLKHLNKQKIKTRFPNIFHKCTQLGIDMSDRIPVVPAAHYTIGGVVTDINGKTDIEHLYVCGEMASTGIMGANRLASNSLAECIVFGYRAVESASKYGFSPQTERDTKFFVQENNAPLYESVKERVSEIISTSAGIVRDSASLKRGIKEIEQIREELLAKLTEKEYYCVASDNLLTVAHLILNGALYRRESRGAHFRSDFPKEDTLLIYHTIQHKEKPISKQYIMPQHYLIDKIIELAIEEDTGEGDITTNALIPAQSRAYAKFTAKSDGVISGIGIIKKVFEHFDTSIVFNPLVLEGERVKVGDNILEIAGSFRALLSGERTALNILQRMSGIATATAQYAEALEGTGTMILDTRKTAPGMRVLDKMAVAAGGGKNHRMGLFDMALIKDNHIKVAGGITNAIKQVRMSIKPGVKIEVETTSIKEVEEALANKADIIMLDNMDIDTMKRAVELIGNRAQTEASGNITLKRVKEIAKTGVNYISSGALTHSVTALDISMNITPEQ